MLIMCEQEKLDESGDKTKNIRSRKHSQGFLSSVFNTHGTFSTKNLFHTSVEEKSPKQEEKSPSFLSSVISSNQGLFSDLSSKIEAALNLSVDASDSDVSSSGRTSRKNSVTDKLSDSSSQADIRRSSLPVTTADHLGRHHRYTKRKGMKHKDRSVYGQPEIKPINSDLKAKTWKDQSQESLDTVDSGQSLGNSSTFSTTTESKLDKGDPFYIYRRTDSVGIGSESDPCGQSTSLESSDAESIPEGGHNQAFLRCGSGSSLQSWASSPSCESQPDDLTLECMEFMKLFVKKIFFECSSITLEEKAKFGELCRQEVGRLWFARWVNTQRVHCKEVSESTFYSLVQYFAIVLFECFEVDDFSPAKSIMNMCFTFYFENPSERLTVYIPCLAAREGRCPAREYLFTYLKDQPIWQSLRFWNAAFFDAVQGERANRHIPTRDDLGHFSPEDLSDEKNFQENIVFGQLGTFTYNMYAFGLSKDFCLQFLRKQCIIGSLSKEHVSLLRESIDRMYSGDIGKEYR